VGAGRLAEGQVVDLTWNPVNRQKLTVLHTIDRLYLRQWFGLGDLTLGRQRIAWGTGRIWNPTDLFNPLNPVTFAKIEKDGVDAAVLKMHLASLTDFTIVVNPENDWRATNIGVRFRTNVAEFDLSSMLGEFRKRVILGGDFAGNFFDAGLRGEGIYVFPRDNRQAFIRFILGADYQFNPDLYGLVEYQYNGEGAETRAAYDLIALAEGRIQNVARNYAVVQGSYLLHPLVTASLSYTRNVDDASGFAGIVVSYAATSEFAVALGAQIFVGEELTEYWYYPATVYLKADVFF
jgi:hypothetical protein